MKNAQPSGAPPAVRSSPRSPAISTERPSQPSQFSTLQFPTDSPGNTGAAVRFPCIYQRLPTAASTAASTKGGAAALLAKASLGPASRGDSPTGDLSLSLTYHTPRAAVASWSTHNPNAGRTITERTPSTTHARTRRPARAASRRYHTPAALRAATQPHGRTPNRQTRPLLHFRSLLAHT